MLRYNRFERNPTSTMPHSCGQPAGRLGQPFYGWFRAEKIFCEAVSTAFPGSNDLLAAKASVL
jgi:hypothetical protein